MGQYYYVVNLDKKQYLHPHRFGDGLKLCEFAASGDGVMFGLGVLLADGNGQGGGDLDSTDPVVGSWAGDRIVVAGDYAEGGRWLDSVEGLDRGDLQAIADKSYSTGYNQPERVNLHHYASERFEDISDRVIKAIADAEGENSALSKIDLSKGGWRDK